MTKRTADALTNEVDGDNEADTADSGDAVVAVVPQPGWLLVGQAQNLFIIDQTALRLLAHLTLPHAIRHALCCTVSGADYLILADETKQLLVLPVEPLLGCLKTSTAVLQGQISAGEGTPAGLQVVSQLPKVHGKKFTALAVDSNGTIVFSDKAGEVHSNTVPQLATSQFLLGHVSCITHMELSPCGRFIITSDRDEKVRITHYPRTQHVEAFCLGHTEFVSTFCTLPGSGDEGEASWCISGGGDGTVRTWRVPTGECTHVVDLPSIWGASSDEKAQCSVVSMRGLTVGKGRYVCLCVDAFSGVAVLKLERGQLEVALLLEETVPVRKLMCIPSGSGVNVWVVRESAPFLGCHALEADGSGLKSAVRDIGGFDQRAITLDFDLAESIMQELRAKRQRREEAQQDIAQKRAT